MSSYNKVTLMGNVGSDPEIINAKNKIAKISIATTETYKNKDGQRVDNVDWHHCICFGGISTIVEKYVKKGNLVMIEGMLRNEKWDDKETGDKRYRTVVKFDNIILLNRSGRSQNSRGNESAEEVEDLPESDLTGEELPLENKKGDLPF